MFNTREYSDTIPAQYEDKLALFKGLDIYVDPRVFIPRPETELLVDVVTDKLRGVKKSFSRILEIGTGSGAVSISLAAEMPGCRITATDISVDALDVARGNIQKHGLSERVRLVNADLFGSDEISCEKFDCIVSNPPYVSASDYEKVDEWVKAEPKNALLAGKEGLDVITAIIRGGAGLLSGKGFIALEIGYDQAGAAEKIFEDESYYDVEIFRDFNGHNRVITGWKNG